MKPERMWMVVLLLLAATAPAQSATAQDEPEVADPVVTKLDQRMSRFLDSIAAGRR